METVKDLVDDYLERHEEAFDEFDTPEDLYESIGEHLDSLEVCRQQQCCHRTASGQPKQQQWSSSSWRAQPQAMVRLEAICSSRGLPLGSRAVMCQRFCVVQGQRAVQGGASESRECQI